VQHLKLLCWEFTPEEGHARDVAARPRETGDKPMHRIGADFENNRDCCGGGFRGERRSVAHGDNYHHLASGQIGRQCWQLTVLIVRPAIFDRDVLAFNIASLLQALLDGGDTESARSH